MKNTLPIVYNGGTYGTYLEWLLNTLIQDAPIQSPFTLDGKNKGNSHGSQHGKQLRFVQGWREYLQSPEEYVTIRLHPKQNRHEKTADILEEILRDCDKMILIYPDHGSELFCIDRFFTKPWNTSDVFNGPLNSTDADNIRSRWPISVDQPLSNIPRWILREYLSYYLMPAWRDQVEWFLPERWQHDRCLIVFVDQLLFDIKTTLDRIQNFWGKDFCKDIDMILPYHNQMLALQDNLHQDSLCQNIIDSLFDAKSDQTWQSLSLVSESWIQWKLRSMNFEIKCHDLCEFPTDTVSLKNLMHEVVS